MIENPVMLASHDLAMSLVEILCGPTFNDAIRTRVSQLACEISLEHWHAVRVLLAAELLPSALVVHRAQYEPAVRAVWTFYAATDSQVEKLGATLTSEAEQGAKNLPQVNQMVEMLGSKAPAAAYQVLANFKESSWRALNSYVHVGIHPLQRQASGYPVRLLEQVLKNANGLAVAAAMQSAVLAGSQQLVHQEAALQRSHAHCLPAA